MVRRDLAIGLDIGGTKTLAVLIDENGNKMKEERGRTLSRSGNKEFLDSMVTLIYQLISETNIDRIQGIGIATAGVINSSTNEIIYANNLSLKNFKIGEGLTGHFQLPVKLTNDANAAALAERKWGQYKNKDNLIYITVSTGIGAGIISNGVTITGMSDNAGEFGHISINPEGPACPCGNRGCLENYASGTAIAKLAQKRIEEGKYSQYLMNKAGGYVYITAEDISKGALQQDNLCVEVLNEAGYYLGVGITNLIHLFNPGVVTLGGGVIKSAASQLLPIIQETISNRGIPSMVEKVEVTHSSLGDDICVKGAASLFLDAETKTS